MIVESRNPDLKYPRHIREEKVMLVLDWLLEFRFSSIPILAARLGQTPVNANRFFRRMLDDGLIQAFANVHTKHYRYVMLTAAGVSYLEAEGRDVSKAITRTARLGRYSRIIHDLSVQACLVRNLDEYAEVIYERNLDYDTQERPDAVVVSKQHGYSIAIEFERWRKDRKRILQVLLSHADNLIKKRYSGVYYYFEHEADRAHYKKIFDQPIWPAYKKESRSGKVVKTNRADFKPDEVQNLRRVFLFRHAPVRGDQVPS